MRKILNCILSTWFWLCSIWCITWLSWSWECLRWWPWLRGWLNYCWNKLSNFFRCKFCESTKCFWKIFKFIIIASKYFNKQRSNSIINTSIFNIKILIFFFISLFRLESKRVTIIFIWLCRMSMNNPSWMKIWNFMKLILLK